MSPTVTAILLALLVVFFWGTFAALAFTARKSRRSLASGLDEKKALDPSAVRKDASGILVLGGAAAMSQPWVGASGLIQGGAVGVGLAVSAVVGIVAIFAFGAINAIKTETMLQGAGYPSPDGGA